MRYIGATQKLKQAHSSRQQSKRRSRLAASTSKRGLLAAASRMLAAASRMGLPSRQLLLPGLAVFGLAVVGFLSLARRDGMPRPTQLRAHQQQQNFSVEVLESASFQTGMDALGEDGMDEVDESPGEQTGVEQAGVVGGKPDPLCTSFVGSYHK